MWNEYNCIEYYVPDKKTVNEKFNLLIVDLDETLITRKNGKIPFYSDFEQDNWIFLGKINKILKKFEQKNYVFCIITNQTKFNSDIKFKIQKVIDKLKIDTFVIVSKKDDDFKKPNIGTVNVLFNLLDVINMDYKKIDEIEPKFEKSEIDNILVSGDAVGNDDLYPPYRWDNTDLYFYENIKKLYEKTKFIRPIDLFPSNEEKIFDKIHETVVIFVGNPGSGKSTFANRLEKKGYTILCQDELKTVNKMLKISKEILKKGGKIVIDATNPSIEKRKLWIELSYLSSIVWFIRNGYHFNNCRQHKIPDVVYNIYSKNFKEPTKNETKIYKIW